MTRELSPKAGATLLKNAFAGKNAPLTHTEALNLLAQLKGFKAWSHFQNETNKGKKLSPVKAPKPSLLTLEQVLRDHYGTPEGYHAFTRRDWAGNVASDDTRQDYWEWVVSTLTAQDLLCCRTEFNTLPKVTVTLPDGTKVQWLLENNLTDRWGEFNEYASDRKPGLAILQLDEALALEDQLLERLREQMCSETTFIARKDGKFGLLYEVEYTSRESESQLCEPEELSSYKPHETVVAALLEGLQKVQGAFPNIEMGVPDSDEIIWNRPAVWAFAPLDVLDETQRSLLDSMLATL